MEFCDNCGKVIDKWRKKVIGDNIYCENCDEEETEEEYLERNKIPNRWQQHIIVIKCRNYINNVFYFIKNRLLMRRKK